MITSWNRGAERLYGYSSADAVGKPISLIIPPGGESEEQEILRRVFSGQSLDHFETQRVRSDGRTVAVSLTISPVKDINGRIVSASIIARDITESKFHEQRLRRLADHDPSPTCSIAAVSRRSSRSSSPGRSGTARAAPFCAWTSTTSSRSTIRAGTPRGMPSSSKSRAS